MEARVGSDALTFINNPSLEWKTLCRNPRCRCNVVQFKLRWPSKIKGKPSSRVILVSKPITLCGI